MNAYNMNGDFVARAATMDDLQTYGELHRAWMVEDVGSANKSDEQLKLDWEEPRWSLAESSYAVFKPDGEMVGFVEILDHWDTPVRPYMWGYVKQAFRGLGIGTHLTQWCLRRSEAVFDRVPDDARVTLFCHINTQAVAAKQLMEDHGFETDRVNYTMSIEFNGNLPAPQFPDGVSMVTYSEKPDMRLFVEVKDAAWKDHRNYVERPLEEQIEMRLHEIENEETFDPKLWWVAMDGDTPAGVMYGWSESFEYKDTAEIEILGVVPEYRGRGLGLAMLHHAFGEFHKRGISKCLLGVDGSSLTGATRLYERAGMRVAQAYDVYEKQIRAGREITRQ
jgi:mycothiol synthase